MSKTATTLNVRKFSCIVLCLLFTVIVTFAQTSNNLSTGKIVEKVVIEANPKHSYTFYLPSSYTPERKWAILYIFDPVARTAFAVERFRPAAEKYNYILVSSNNSRNGIDGAALSESITLLWNDTHNKFSIDEKRVYAAGFSGGARAASLIATACESCLAGIIGSGAGYWQDIKPKAQQKFSFYGTAGLEDYNFWELIQLEKTLNNLKIANHLEIFAGVHQWMPVEVAEKALAWMNLQAMKKGDLPIDTQFISDLLALRTAEAKGFLSTGDTLKAARTYRNIVSDFTGLKDVSEYSRKSSEINNSPEFKRARKLQDEQIIQQSQFINELVALSSKQLQPMVNPDDVQAFKIYIADLNKKAQSADKSEQLVAKRTLAEFFAYTRENAIHIYIKQKKFDLAVAMLKMAAAASPKNSFIRFEVATTYALDGKKKQALAALEEAVSLGFRDLKRIETEESFADWRNDERFQKLLTELKKKPENIR